MPNASRTGPPAGADLSFAEEAVELAASVGLVADKWQADVVRAALATTPAALWASPRVGLSVPRQNGKGSCLEIIELAAALSGYRVIHTAHLVATSIAHLQRVLALVEHPDVEPLVKRIVRTNGKEAIEFASGGRIAFVARSKASGRGLSADILVCDEAQILPEEVFAALLPTISASPNPLTLLTGTPPGPLDDGTVFERFRDAGLGGDDGRLTWIEYSAADDAPVGDPATWATANPAVGTRLAVDTIRDELAAMDPETFRRERLGKWTDYAARVSPFDLEAWAALADSSAFRDAGRLFLGVDVSKDRSRAAIVACARLRGSGDLALEVIEAGSGSAWVVPTLQKLVAARPNTKIVLDELARPLLNREARIPKGKIIEANFADVKAAAAAMIDAVRGHSVKHRDQGPLTSAVENAQISGTGDATKFLRVDGSEPLIAASMAFYAASQKTSRDDDGPRHALVL